MDDVVTVDKGNCDQIAQKIVNILSGRKFAIVSFYNNVPERHETPTILDERYLCCGYRNIDGCVTIKLFPSRKIFWDLDDEKVTVSFVEDENIIIERVLPNGRTIFRAIVVSK